MKNLFTAFVAWQFVGLCLYLLLNHYHYDVKANRAAKKKFVINRVGDVCFLLAVLLTYSHYGTTSFLVLFFKHIGLSGSSIFVSQTTILALLFVAVMTKSAQFPFHIWLPDTMETPTPVSALMHAGVINAGGFLLARLSPWFIQQPTLLSYIFVIGLLTTLVGGFFMLTQVDIKKQLAYSTIGQMGYMVMQCGLGCFAAAVFHLIAHGFFKGSLFLHAGNVLSEPSTATGNQEKSLSTVFFTTLVLTGLLVAAGFCLLIWLGEPHAFNKILWLFLVLTLAQFIRHIVAGATSIKAMVGAYSLLGLAFFGYLSIVTHFNHMLEGIALENAIKVAPWEWWLVVSALLIIAGIRWHLHPLKKAGEWHKKLYTLSLTKAGLEQAYRHYFLKPLRQIGEWHYLILKTYARSQRSVCLFISLVLSFLAGCTVLGVFVWYQGLFIYNTKLLWINLVLFVLSLLIANRTRSLKELWLFLFSSGLTLTNLALFAREDVATTIGIFHLINMIILSLALGLLIVQQNKKALPSPIRVNKLPWVNVYMSIFLLLLIGVPGTAGFISEFYLLQGLMAHHMAFAVILAFSFVLLSIVILHTLQVYIFNPGHFSRLDPDLSPMLHIVFWLAISFNVWNGVCPQPMLNALSIIQGAGL